MERLIELGRLMDFYGSLLSQRQREALSRSVYEDCSLSEIAEQLGVSRQAVRDAIVHGEARLRAFESALGLLRKDACLRETAASLDAAAAAMDGVPEAKRALNEAAQRILRAWEEDDDGV